MFNSAYSIYISVMSWFFGDLLTTLPILNNFIVPLGGILWGLWFLNMLLVKPFTYFLKILGDTAERL